MIFDFVRGRYDAAAWEKMYTDLERAASPICDEVDGIGITAEQASFFDKSGWSQLSGSGLFARESPGRDEPAVFHIDESSMVMSPLPKNAEGGTGFGGFDTTVMNRLNETFDLVCAPPLTCTAVVSLFLAATVSLT